jgi:hypothetical protein
MHLDKYRGKTVVWRGFKLEYLLQIFEEGLISHFSNYSNIGIHIGIGTLITKRPSHSTVHTDRVYGGSADQAG